LHQGFLIYQQSGFLCAMPLLSLSKAPRFFGGAGAKFFFRLPLCFLFGANTRFDRSPHPSFLSRARLCFFLCTTKGLFFCPAL
jgi:hypothetical protein